MLEHVAHNDKLLSLHCKCLQHVLHLLEVLNALSAAAALQKAAYFSFSLRTSVVA